jgi:hypothetical protein
MRAGLRERVSERRNDSARLGLKLLNMHGLRRIQLLGLSLFVRAEQEAQEKDSGGSPGATFRPKANSRSGQTTLQKRYLAAIKI